MVLRVLLLLLYFNIMRKWRCYLGTHVCVKFIVYRFNGSYCRHVCTCI